MFTYTKDETAAINAAFAAIEYLSGCTNWEDPGKLRNAMKLERAEMKGTTAARGMIVKAWYEGASDPEQPVSAICHIRPGYLGALLLGVRHKLERADSDYTGPLFRKAFDLCPAAIAAHEAMRARAVQG